MNVILGLDLSSVSSGAVVIESTFGGSVDSVQCLATDTFVVNPKDKLSMGEKCLYMASSVAKMIAEHKVTTVAIEDVFFTQYLKTYRALAMIHGAVAAEIAHCGLPVEWYTSAAARKLVFNHGDFKKKDVQQKLSERFSFKNLPPIAEWNNDQSDALAVALAHETVLYGKHVSFKRFSDLD